MNKITRNIAALIAFGIGTTTIGFAQVTQQKIGNNPTLINANAALEIESTSKGFLMPRLALTATNSSLPLSAHVEGMTVYNTAISGTAPNNVTPGYYYNDGVQWVRIATGADAKTEPWLDQVTDDEATLNTQNIYQTGNVAIQKTDNIAGTALDVEGAVRGGTNSSTDVGVNSVAFGTENVAAGNNSFVAGQNNTLWGTGSAVFGSGNNIGTVTNEGNWSLVAGLRNTTNSSRAFIFGIDNIINNPANGIYEDYLFGARNIANGAGNYLLGNDLQTTGAFQMAIGQRNAIQTSGNQRPAGDLPALTEPVFQIGVGRNSISLRNAMTVLYNSYTGIGIVGTEASAKPTEMLDIGSEGVRIRDINTVAYTGGSTDNIVVADAQGILKTVSAASVASATEPWRIQTGTAQATANTQNIYQQGNVAVGDFSTAASTKKMEVKGDFKSEISAAGGVVGTEVGSPLNPNGAMHYWSNGTDYRTASANDFSATLEAKTGTTTNSFAAGSTQSQMASQNGTNSLSTIRTTNTGNFFMETYNVTGQYGSTMSLQNDGLRLVHTTTNGAADPFPNSNRSEILLQKENGVRFNFRDAAGAQTGEYWFPLTTGTNGQVMTQTATGKMVWTNASALATNNIYNVDGILTGNRTVTTGSNFLRFTGNGSNVTITNTATQGRVSAVGVSRGSLGIDGGSGATNSSLELYADASNLAQINASGTGSTGLSMGTTVATPLIFKTSGVNRMTITATGEVAIGSATAPSFTVGATTVQPKLHIAGDVSTTGKYYTTNSVYADYVFEKYFKGSSEINPSYEFKSLNYVKDFIKANNHLPGVESINDLNKNENGYTFDMTKLTIQSLEKIEELYLHTIEQQDKIDAQQVEIEVLKKQSQETEERVKRLEEMLLKKEN